MEPMSNPRMGVSLSLSLWARDEGISENCAERKFPRVQTAWRFRESPIRIREDCEVKRSEMDIPLQ